MDEEVLKGKRKTVSRSTYGFTAKFILCEALLEVSDFYKILLSCNNFQEKDCYRDISDYSATAIINFILKLLLFRSMPVVLWFNSRDNKGLRFIKLCK